jgi:hypothetical protein
MSIVIVLFSAAVFVDGWPDSNMCQRWSRPTQPGPYEPLPSTSECIKAINDLRIMLGVSGGVGVIIGILVLTTLVLRLVALYRTKFWVGQKLGFFRGSGLNSGGFTVQFTLSVLPNERPVATVSTSQAANPSPSAEEGRLIET